MKEEIQQKETKNQELNDEIKRLMDMIQDSLDGSEVHKDLLNELKIKEDQMAKRDQEINGLVSEKQQMEANKQELMSMIEQMKQQQLSDRKKLLMSKAQASEVSKFTGADVEQVDQLKNELEEQKS